MAVRNEPKLGILMLQGKMAQVPGCMACEDTFPYPVVRRVVEGSSTPFTAEEAEAMLPLYVKTTRELEREGISVITANCGLIALMQQELAASVTVPVVTSSLVIVPTVYRMLGPGKKVGILTFFTDAVGERNYKACGWSSSEIPVVLGGVGGHASWLQFLRTKEVDDDLHARLAADLITTARGMLAQHPEIGAFVAECTMVPAAVQELRAELNMPVYDVLTVLDWTMSGYLRPAAARKQALSN